MVTEEILTTGEVQDIAAFIAACAFPPEAFVLAERFPQQVIKPEEQRNLLRFARLENNVDLGLFSSGRIFHEQFELRWERETQTTHIVYLGQPRELPGLPPGQPLTVRQPGLQAHETTYYLFGEELDAGRLAQMGLPQGQGYYAEVRIPRLLQYPVQGRRVRLVVREYVARQSNRVQIFRFQDLKPVEE